MYIHIYPCIYIYIHVLEYDIISVSPDIGNDSNHANFGAEFSFSSILSKINFLLSLLFSFEIMVLEDDDNKIMVVVMNKGNRMKYVILFNFVLLLLSCERSCVCILWRFTGNNETNIINDVYPE